MSILPRYIQQFSEKLSAETAKADRKVRAITAKSAKRIESFEEHAAALERQVAEFLAGDSPAEGVDVAAFKAWSANGTGHKNGSASTDATGAASA